MAVKMRLSWCVSFLLLFIHASDCFVVQPCIHPHRFYTEKTTLLAAKSCTDTDNNSNVRRSLLQIVAASLPFITTTLPAFADFAPGGTLVDYPIGVQVGNAQASPSRAFDNSNVLFKQDYYFKFGTAAPFIPPGSTDFPKSMPFAPSQQRYDTLKKYGNRIKQGVTMMDSLLNTLEEIPDPALLHVYQLRPMGLMANGFLASENTGTTNELLLSRYYINEMYLDISDMRNAVSQPEKEAAWKRAKQACNSYLGLMNRVITQKVRDKFDLLSI
jgi:hypothetical protein